MHPLKNSQKLLQLILIVLGLGLSFGVVINFLFIIPSCISFLLFGLVYSLEHHKEINSIKTDKASIEKKLKDLEDNIERIRISASMVFKK